jgi:hypothetical protein
LAFGMVVAFFFIAALVFVAVGACFNGGHRGDPWWKGGRRPEATYDGGWRRPDAAPGPPLRQQRRSPAARGRVVLRPGDVALLHAADEVGTPCRDATTPWSLGIAGELAAEVAVHAAGLVDAAPRALAMVRGRDGAFEGVAGEVAVHAAGLVDAAPRALAMVRGRDGASEGIARDVAAAAASKRLHIQAAALLVMEEREEWGCCCGRAAGGAGGRGRGGRAGGRGRGGRAGGGGARRPCWRGGLWAPRARPVRYVSVGSIGFGVGPTILGVEERSPL